MSSRQLFDQVPLIITQYIVLFRSFENHIIFPQNFLFNKIIKWFSLVQYYISSIYYNVLRRYNTEQSNDFKLLFSFSSLTIKNLFYGEIVE